MGRQTRKMDKVQGVVCQLISTALKSVIGFVMLGVGQSYLADCPNGAANYLFCAGIIIVVANVVGLVSNLAKRWAESDGKVSSMESCMLCLINTVSALLLIADIVVLFWGSVVVFGAYSQWSDKEEDIDKDNYCANTPFMTAFVILILDWIVFPFVCMCTCFSLICKTLCKSS